MPVEKPKSQALAESYLREPRTPHFPLVAEYLFELGAQDEALFVLEKGIAEFPVLSSARLLLAKFLYLRALIPEALVHVEKLQETQPRIISLMKLRLRLAVLQDQKDLTLVLLKSLGELISDDELMRKCRLGIALSEFGSVKKLLAEESPDLADWIRFQKVRPAKGSLETLRQAVARGNPGASASQPSSADASNSVPGEFQNMGTETELMQTKSLNSFVPVGTSAAVKLAAEPPIDPRLAALTKLLEGLEKLG